MVLSKFAARAASRQPGFSSTQPHIELGGLIEDENPLSVGANNLKVALNCARKGGMTGTRPGVAYGDSDYTAALSGTPDVQGIFQYARDRDETNDLIVVAGGDVYINNGGLALDKATNTVTISSGQNNLWRFASFQDKVFAAGGATDDSFWYWDGAGASVGVHDGELQKVDLGFDVKYVFSQWNMLFVAGMDGTLGTKTFDDNDMIIRYCDYATDATDPANYKSSNVIPGQLLGENFGIGSYGSEFVTGIANYSDNRTEQLLMLTNRRIAAFGVNPTLSSNADAFILVDTVATGCVSQDAFVNLGLDVGDSVYLSIDGVHSMAQSQQYGNRVTEYLSWNIRKTFDTLNRSRLKYASGAFWPNEGLVLFAVSTGSNTVNDTILCMDIKNARRLAPSEVRWYKWTLSGLNANRIVPIRASDGVPYPYVGGNDGEVVRFDRDTYSDLAVNNISVEFQTGDNDMGIPSREKHYGDLYAAFQGNGDYSVRHTYVFDDGERFGQTSNVEVPNGGAQWNVGVWGQDEWGRPDATKRQRIPGLDSSQTIGHRFAHSGLNEPFWVGLMAQEAMISGPTDDAEANTVGA